MNNPLVSVIVATYKREKPLKNALKSLASQSYHNYEIVLIDDNDNNEWNKKVENIVNEFKFAFPSVAIKYYQNHPNQGSAKSRNRGIGEANGQYVTFLDDDDLYLPDKIESQITAMELEKADFSIMDLSLYYDDESLCEIRKRNYLCDQNVDLLLCHLKYHITGTDTMMFKTEYINSFGGFEPIDVGDEFYLMMKAIQKGGKFLYIPQNKVKAYVHFGENGLSSGTGKIAGENRLYQYKKQFFSDMNAKDQRYIKMRHHAVLAYAYYRDKKLFKFFCNGILSFLIAPFSCLKLLKGMK